MARSLIRWAHRRLLAHFGQPLWESRNEPLDELMGTILSQHTSDVNSERAFLALKRAYSNWEAVRDAPEAELVGVIRPGGLAVVKAARIQAVLRALSPETDDVLALPDLRRMRRADAVRFLTSLPGVGRKTAACVLLFGAHVPAIPVDTHVHRVALRVGLVQPRTTPDAACDVLEAAIPPAEQYAFHINLIRLGRQICKAQRPHCPSCPLQAGCKYALQLS